MGRRHGIGGPAPQGAWVRARISRATSRSAVDSGISDSREYTIDRAAATDPETTQISTRGRRAVPALLLPGGSTDGLPVLSIFRAYARRSRLPMVGTDRFAI
jgi:hypothetical protein